MSGLRILADENIPGLDEFFGSLGRIRTRPGRAIQAADLAQTDVLLVRSVTHVDESLLAGSPVVFVGTATIGTDHLDIEYLQSQGIHWASAPGCNALAVGDYVLACLALAAHQRRQSLADLSVGIVGCGNVGEGVRQRLTALGLRVLANDPPREAAGSRGLSTLDEVLACDAVCLHAPLVTNGPWPSHHLLDAERIRSLRPDQWLISAGRGAVVDNSALRERLQQGDGGPWTALDVWEGEPGIDARLAQLVQVATPHIAGYSLEGKLRGTAMVHQALCAHLGVESREGLGSLLPPVEPVAVDVEEGGDPFSVLSQTLLAAYNPQSDTASLKATLGMSEADRRAAFDRLRKEYPVRREFGYQAPEGVRDPAALRLLDAAGFATVTGTTGS